MLFRMIYDDSLAQAAYLIGCQRTGEAVIIDPERDVDRYLDLAAREGMRITAVTETHIHADFLSGARELAERTGARLYLSGAGDEEWQYRWLEKKAGGGTYDHVLVRDGDGFSVGNIDFTVVHTPGHTPEHISFLVTDRGGGANEPMGIATGDFVFVGDLGRPDLLESAAGVAGAKEPSARRLAASARRFLELPDHLQVWPAHGAGSACGKALGAVPQSTIGYEKRFNPALRLAEDEEAFVEYILEGQPEPPLYFGRMKIENRAGPALLGALPAPRETDPADLAGLDPTRVAIVDTRPWAAFRAGHLPGSLFAPLGPSFTTVTGSYVRADEDVSLVIEEDHVEAAVRALVRIGLDRVKAYVTPAALEAFGAGGGSAATIPEVGAHDLIARRGSGEAFILDVRRAVEHAEASIPGVPNIAHTRLLDRIGEVPDDRPVFVHCRSGVRSSYACALLRRFGHDAVNVTGGFLAWEAAGGGVARGVGPASVVGVVARPGRGGGV